MLHQGEPCTTGQQCHLAEARARTRIMPACLPQQHDTTATRTVGRRPESCVLLRLPRGVRKTNGLVCTDHPVLTGSRCYPPPLASHFPRSLSLQHTWMEILHDSIIRAWQKGISTCVCFAACPFKCKDC